jgi:hypothetical protein
MIYTLFFILIGCKDANENTTQLKSEEYETFFLMQKILVSTAHTKDEEMWHGGHFEFDDYVRLYLDKDTCLKRASEMTKNRNEFYENVARAEGYGQRYDITDHICIPINKDQYIEIRNAGYIKHGMD